MGEYTRTYRFTGQTNVGSARTVDFSKFNIASGDTEHKVAKILGIQYVHWHTSTIPMSWELRGRLMLADGTTIVSDRVTNHISGNVVKFVNTFADPITPEQFAQLEKVQTLDNRDSISGSSYHKERVLYWRATSDHPMDLILTFSDIPDVQTSGIGSVNSITLNGSSAVKVSISKLSDRARHTVTWKLGSYSHTSGIVNTEASFVPPLEWLNAVTASKTGTGTVVLKTYADDDTALTQQIGEDVTASFTVTVPDSMRPTVSAGWASAAPYNAGQAAGLTDYIQGYSKVQLTFDPSRIATYYGAAIQSYSYTVQNTTVTAADHISGLLKASGISRIVLTVTDSRGFTNDTALDVAALDINVLPYAEPKMSDVTVLRSENSGPPTDGVNGDADGTYIYAAATAVVANGVGLKSLILMYREKGFTTFTTVALTSGQSSVIPGLLAGRTYEVVLTVTDRLSNSYSISYIFAHKQLTFNVKNGGKAAGFGAMPGDDNTLRFGWHLVLEQGLTSFVPLLPIGACVMLDSTLDPVAAMGGAWTEISWGNAPAGVKLWKRTQ